MFTSKQTWLYYFIRFVQLQSKLFNAFFLIKVIKILKKFLEFLKKCKCKIHAVEGAIDWTIFRIFSLISFLQCRCVESESSRSVRTHSKAL